MLVMANAQKIISHLCSYIFQLYGGFTPSVSIKKPGQYNAMGAALASFHSSRVGVDKLWKVGNGWKGQKQNVVMGNDTLCPV